MHSGFVYTYIFTSLFFFSQLRGKMKTWELVFAALVVVLNLRLHVHGAPQAPCYFIFGDSLADNGNNNLLQTKAKVNYLPYGIDFPTGPTGRFTNGLTMFDMIGLSLSLSLGVRLHVQPFYFVLLCVMLEICMIYANCNFFSLQLNFQGSTSPFHPLQLLMTWTYFKVLIMHLVQQEFAKKLGNTW